MRADHYYVPAPDVHGCLSRELSQRGFAVPNGHFQGTGSARRCFRYQFAVPRVPGIDPPSVHRLSPFTAGCEVKSWTSESSLGRAVDSPRQER